MQARKMPLIMTVLFFTTICNTPPAVLPANVAFQLLECQVLGWVLSLAVSLLVFPSFALSEIDEHKKAVLHSYETAVQQAVAASHCHCAVDPVSCRMQRMQSVAHLERLTAQMRDNVALMRLLLHDSTGEFAPVVRAILHWRLSTQQDVDLCSQLVLHAQGMLALSNDFDHSASMDGHELSDALQAFVRSHSALLQDVRQQGDAGSRSEHLEALRKAAQSILAQSLAEPSKPTAPQMSAQKPCSTPSATHDVAVQFHLDVEETDLSLIHI